MISEPDEFFLRLRERTGLVIPDNRRAACATIVSRAIGAASARSTEHYQRLLDDHVVFDALVDELSIGETYFFRDPRQLDFVRREVVPELVRRRGPTHALSAWSAGCATGEEAYSLAVLLLEAELGAPPRVLGTDLSRRRLAVARKGRYGKWSLRGVEPDVVDRHFRRMGSVVEVDARIRSAVRFQYLNLAGAERGSLEPRALDLVVCRNVLIYMDAPTIERVVRRLVSSLAEGGWLLLGASDPSLPENLPCEVVLTDAGLAYRRIAKHAKARRPTGILRASRLPATTEPDALPTQSRPRTDEKPPYAPVPTPVAPAERSAPVNRVKLVESAESRASTVRALADAGKLSEAALACAVALEAHPLCAELSVLQSFLLLELGRPELAAEAARRALYLEPDLVMAHLASGSAARGAGNARAANRSFRNALRLLDRCAPASVIPASGGEVAERLSMIAQAQLQALEARVG
jgi:chemotaxis protein methyltransferase CheR